MECQGKRSQGEFQGLGSEVSGRYHFLRRGGPGQNRFGSYGIPIRHPRGAVN